MHRTLETYLYSSVQDKGAACGLPGALKRPMLQDMVCQGPASSVTHLGNPVRITQSDTN